MPNSDRIQLIVNGQKVENFLDYQVDADIYTADHAFSFRFSNTSAKVISGSRCELRVNDVLAMTGIIDKVTRSTDRDGVTLRAEGRDLMGLLVDSYCETFPTLKDKTLSQIAATLLVNVPFIQRSAIVYEQDVVATMAGPKPDGRSTLSQLSATGNEPAHKYVQIDPGTTVFEALKKYAMSRGLLFFGLPNGTFVFGRPKAQGAPAYSIVMSKKDPSKNNALSGSYTDDISSRYSKVTVIGQRQGRDTDGVNGAANINTGATATDPTFPFYKPYVTTDNNDEFSPSTYARLILEKQRARGFELHYRVPGHTQKGKAWTVNELCRVQDEVAQLDGVYLIFGRTFELSRDGKYTSLRLGLPGLVR
jgi:prophage tail gpP-like protein